eukprot:13498261-Alexandrium_andersonii.AAC.1
MCRPNRLVAFGEPSGMVLCRQQMSSGYVYVLALESGKFYVGWSSDPARRVAEHFLGCGSAWCCAHAPREVLSVEPGGRELEDAKTVALMVQKGWENVRGGRWAFPVLTHVPAPIADVLARGRTASANSAAWESVAKHCLVVDTVADPDLPAGTCRARLVGPWAIAACPDCG